MSKDMRLRAKTRPQPSPMLWAQENDSLSLSLSKLEIEYSGAFILVFAPVSYIKSGRIKYLSEKFLLDDILTIFS